MAYDPRPVSEGGNRGLDEEFSRKAPKGKFRVVAVDTFDGTDWVAGVFDTLEAAMTRADALTKNQDMLKTHVYDDAGNHCYGAGTF